MTVPPVVALAAFPRGAPSRLHALARAFHAGDPAAADEVAALAVAYLAGDGAHRETVVSSGGAIVAVAVPGHLAGRSNRPVEDLLGRLALEMPGLVTAPGALVRIAATPPAREVVGPRDPAGEALTLRWHEDRLPARAGRVLLVDDVVWTGATLEAALRAAPALLRVRIVPLALFRAED